MRKTIVILATICLSLSARADSIGPNYKLDPRDISSQSQWRAYVAQSLLTAFGLSQDEGMSLVRTAVSNWEQQGVKLPPLVFDDPEHPIQLYVHASECEKCATADILEFGKTSYSGPDDCDINIYTNTSLFTPTPLTSIRPDNPVSYWDLEGILTHHIGRCLGLVFPGQDMDQTTSSMLNPLELDGSGNVIESPYAYSGYTKRIPRIIDAQAAQSANGKGWSVWLHDGYLRSTTGNAPLRVTYDGWVYDGGRLPVQTNIAPSVVAIPSSDPTSDLDVFVFFQDPGCTLGIDCPEPFDTSVQEGLRVKSYRYGRLGYSEFVETGPACLVTLDGEPVITRDSVAVSYDPLSSSSQPQLMLQWINQRKYYEQEQFLLARALHTPMSISNDDCSWAQLQSSQLTGMTPGSSPVAPLFTPGRHTNMFYDEKRGSAWMMGSSIEDGTLWLFNTDPAAPLTWVYNYDGPDHLSRWNVYNNGSYLRLPRVTGSPATVYCGRINDDAATNFCYIAYASDDFDPPSSPMRHLLRVCEYDPEGQTMVGCITSDVDIGSYGVNISSNKDWSLPVGPVVPGITLSTIDNSTGQPTEIPFNCNRSPPFLMTTAAACSFGSQANSTTSMPTPLNTSRHFSVWAER